jgi:NTE family protein
MSAYERQPFSLALSGGGAKCAAEAGVLTVLDEAGVPVRALTGVSAGGLVAVLYGLGVAPAAIRDYIAETHLLEVWETDPGRRAVLGEGKSRERLRAMVGDKTFADLKRPVTVVTAELCSGREVRLTSGSLEAALMATMAIPGLFPPQVLEGQTLVDGGLVNPLPADVARGLGRPVLAVDLLSGSLCSTVSPQLFETRGPLRYVTEVGRRLGLLEMAELVHQAALIATHRILRYNLQANPPDVLLLPAVERVGLFAFDLAEAAYDAGREAAQAALPQILAVTNGTAEAVQA